MLRHPENVEKLIPVFQKALLDFFGRAPLEESSIILDGPGIGCASLALLLALIGMERLSRFKCVNFFSSSGFAGFFMDASQKQQLKVNREDVFDWNRRNQQRHNVRFLLTALGFVVSKMVGKRWYFRNHLLSDALRSIVTDHYADSMVEALPDNFHFWTYNETSHQFCDIHAHSEYLHWTPSEVIRSLTAVKGLYEPFGKNNHIFSDAVSNPRVREVFRKIRNDNSNVLFWHMKRHGQRDNTLFIKGHQSRSGLTRIVGDFVLFLLGVDNPEVGRSIELSLFDLPMRREYFST